MKTRKLWVWLLVLASFAFVPQVSTIAKAQDDVDSQNQDQNQDQDQDPPGRVARLNFSQGSISFRPAGEDDWVSGVPNRPMVTGDDLWSDENSCAEVHIGSTAIRLGAKTGITFLTLDDRTTQIRLAQGSIILRVRHVDDEDNYEIDTPNIALSILQPGEYRVDVSEDGSQTITDVWHGRGRVTGGGLTYNVVAGQSATFTGNEQHLDYDLGQIPDRDDFESWAFERDDREDHADSANYVSREMTGYEDLDESGDWSYVAGYGPCWRPRAVVVGWAPYRFGHWLWISPWGWTWVPLAPGEVYLPGYHVSRAYVNNVNITNTAVTVTKVTNVYNTVIVNKSTTINNITYVNQHVNNGVTVVSHDTFVNARPVAGNVMRVDPKEIASAPVSHIAHAEPIRTSVIGAGRPVSVRPPAAVISRPVVAVRTPPPPPRSMEQRQVQAGGHLNEQALVRPVGPAQPAPTTQRPQQTQEGFKPFTPTNGGNSQVRPMQPTQLVAHR